MKCPVEYWIWLQRTLGSGKDVDELIAFFGNPMKMYEAGRAGLADSGLVNRKTADALAKFSPSESYTVIKQCEANGWSIIAYDDERYPEKLKRIQNSPVVLYVCGDAGVLKNDFCVGIVGTRDASENGIRAAKNISSALANVGAVIVSGGALGIDSASHEAAIAAGGKTIAFLGSGLGSKYLAANEALRQSISENGALVSEFLPFTDPTRYTFPVRNRLISGISRGVVVVEAGEKSGSIITAQYARKQGRDLFAVPGEIYNKSHAGTNMLINNGAVPLFGVSDIITYYDDVIRRINSGNVPEYREMSYAPHSEKKKNVQITWQEADHEKPVDVKPQKKENAEPVKKSQLPEYASDNAVKLYGMINAEPKTVDEYVVSTGMTVQDVLSALTELELYSVVAIQSGKRYGLKNN